VRRAIPPLDPPSIASSLGGGVERQPSGMRPDSGTRPSSRLTYLLTALLASYRA
jgi:hypothetical protein